MFLKIELQIKDSVRYMLEVSISIWITASITMLKHFTESITFKCDHFIIMESTTRTQHHNKTNTTFLVWTAALYSKVCCILCEKISLCRLCPGFCHEKKQNIDISSSLKKVNVIKWLTMRYMDEPKGTQPLCGETFTPDATSLRAIHTVEAWDIGEGFLAARRKKQSCCHIHRIILWYFLPTNPARRKEGQEAAAQ